MISKNLHLYRIEIPWFNHNGHLLLAVPIEKRPSARDKNPSVAWNLKIRGALTELQNGGEFEEVWKEHKPRQLVPLVSGVRKNTETFKWNGWKLLVLPAGCSFGLDGELTIPMSPSRNPVDWPHNLCWNLKDIFNTLDSGGSVLQFHPNGLATAGYLTALLSAIADPQVHPHKIIYHVLTAGLGLNSFHYGIMLGMDQSDWRRLR